MSGEQERGKAARELAPRSSPERWTVSPERPDPVGLLEAQAANRVQELVPIRYGRMLASPFSFFRGAAAVMAADLSAMPSTGIVTQLCGDAHLSNFGVFAAPDRRLVFDVNDFDETLPGPWEWDLMRLVASVEVTARERGLGRKQRVVAVQSAASGYRERIRELAGQGALEAWYRRFDVEEFRDSLDGVLGESTAQAFEKGIDKARVKDSTRAYRKLVEFVDGEPRIRSNPPLITPIEEVFGPARVRENEGRLIEILDAYTGTLTPGARGLLKRYRLTHIAHKVVGVGSVGLRAWVVLLVGREKGDPLVLQLKEAGRSVLEPYTRRSVYRRQGRRVIEGQRLMQAAGDVLLGWVKIEGLDGVPRDYYVRQLWDAKGSARVDQMSARTLAFYGRLCGAVLATAHARSGSRVAIASYLGGGDRFDRSMVEFAGRYADQNERDFEALRAAADADRIRVELEED